MRVSFITFPSPSLLPFSHVKILLQEEFCIFFQKDAGKWNFFHSTSSSINFYVYQIKKCFQHIPPSQFRSSKKLFFVGLFLLWQIYLRWPLKPSSINVLLSLPNLFFHLFFLSLKLWSCDTNSAPLPAYKYCFPPSHLLSSCAANNNNYNKNLFFV